MRVSDRTSLHESNGGESPTDYLQLNDYTRILYRRRWVIAAIMAVGLACAALYNWMTVPLYESSATLQMDMDLNVLGVDRPLMPLDQRDWMREFLPTQLGILQSRELARLAVTELNRPGAPSLPSSDGAASQVPLSRTPTVNEIVGGRSVEAVRDTRLVNVGFRDRDPQVTAAVANALARAYLQQNQEFRSRASGDAADWLVKQVEQQRKLVGESEAALQNYRREHGADALRTDAAGVQPQNIVVQELSQLQQAATEARTETIMREAEYRQVAAARANQQPLDTVPAIASNVPIQSLKAELATLQRQLAQASTELGERHPDIIKLQGAVASAERKLTIELANAALTIENDYQVAQRREREMNAALQRQQGEVQALNGKAVQYTALEREAETNRTVLDTLLQRSREADLARQLLSTNVRVVDWATVPEEPVLPRKGRTMLIAAAGSGMFALGLTFVLELFNTRLRSPQEVKRHLHIPVMGVTPQVKGGGRRDAVLIGNGAPAQFAELFRAVRTNLVLTPELAAGRSLLITSAEPAEGKTISAANLAVSLTRLNQRVALIDADMRNPRLHEVFGENQQPGLADVLTGMTASGVLRKTKVPNLWLMPAGSASRSPGDLLGSIAFSDLIQEMRKRFDWIIVDSSPVLAVTDPCLIAPVVSGVLLVVDGGQTTRATAAAAVERLDAVQANIVGAMLNRAVIQKNDDSYLPYYHREYNGYYPELDDSFSAPGLPAARINDESPDAAASGRQG